MMYLNVDEERAENLFQRLVVGVRVLLTPHKGGLL